MNRKDNKIKELQDECKKRKIGFMTNWTKTALIKRLEDEDVREQELLNATQKAKQAERRLEEKPKQMLDALELELISAQENYDKLLEEVNVMNEQKAALGEKYQEAQKRLHLIEEAIATVKRVTMDGNLFK